MQAVQLICHKKPCDDIIKKIEAATIKQNSHFASIIDEKRKNPGEDIASKLLNAEIDGKRLSDDMLNNALDLLIRSGFLTPVHQLGNILVQLERRPDLRKSLVDSPHLIPAFVDEMLRLYSSVAASYRHTTQDVTIHGVTIPKGSQVTLLLAAANRDPRKFSNPDEIDLSRKSEHLAFGYGPHACVGLLLARLELEIAIECLLPRVESITCPTEHQLKWINSNLVRGLEELPVSLGCA